MHQAVVVDPDVHERAEARHVGHDSRQHHARLQVCEVVDVGEAEHLECRARVSPRLAELGDDVLERRAPDFVGDVGVDVDRRPPLGIAEQVQDRAAQVLGDLLHQGVALRVHRAAVQWVRGIADPQETRRRRRPSADRRGDLGQAERGSKPTRGAASCTDDGGGQLLGQARRCGRATGAAAFASSTRSSFDGTFDRVGEAGRQRARVDVVLVLADADRLRVELDQLGQRILKAPPIETAPRTVRSRSGYSRATALAL